MHEKRTKVLGLFSHREASTSVWWFILGYSSFNIYLSHTKELLAEVAVDSPMGLLQALAELLAVLMMLGVKKLPFKPESLRVTGVLCTAFAAVLGLGIRSPFSVPITCIL